jgi:hypothetical protein
MPSKNPPPPPVWSPWSGVAVAPAPYLDGRSMCSECHIRALTLANGELKVCPRCFAVLWHADYSEEFRHQRMERERINAERRAEQKRIQDERIQARLAAGRQERERRQQDEQHQQTKDTEQRR